MAMFDALGRAGFHRLLAGHVLSTIAEDPEAYTVFDFSRFHKVQLTSSFYMLQTSNFTAHLLLTKM